MLQLCSNIVDKWRVMQPMETGATDPDAQEIPVHEDDVDSDQEPLYNGSTVTLGSIMVLLALFVIKHSLCGEAIEHLLSIFAAALPVSNVLPRTISRFRKYFCHL